MKGGGAEEGGEGIGHTCQVPTWPVAEPAEWASGGMKGGGRKDGSELPIRPVVTPLRLPAHPYELLMKRMPFIPFPSLLPHLSPTFTAHRYELLMWNSDSLDSDPGLLENPAHRSLDEHELKQVLIRNRARRGD